jgi:predicted small metal-binding protein
MRAMKTMTCRQLGGPCELALHGNTADEVIKLQDKHLREIVANGDDAHQGALKEMKGRWKRPIAGMGWYRKAKRDFAALPEEE